MSASGAERNDSSLEVWCVVLLRYRLRPTRYLWRSIRTYEDHLYPFISSEDDTDGEESPTSRHPRQTLVREGA
jgi:hypothetical protein